MRQGSRAGVRWARLRELEAWAGRGRRRRKRGRGQRISRFFQHHRHRHSRGNWGQEGSSWAGAGIELLVNWAGLAVAVLAALAGQQQSSGARLIPCKSQQIAPDAAMHATWTCSLLWLRRRQYSVVWSKKRKKGHTWTEKLLLVGPQPKSRFSLLRRTQNMTLVRPESIRSVQGWDD